MERKQIPLYTVDAFSDKPFGGNPAAVCLLSAKLEKSITDEERQKIGAEINLSETVFVTLQGEGDFTSESKFGIRWFTPTSEVDLCGHATLASAAVIFYEQGNTSAEIEFSSRSGILKVQRSSNNQLTMNFPLNPPSPRVQDDLKSLLEVCVGDLSLIQDVQLSQTKKLLVRVKDDVNRKTLEDFQIQTSQMIATYNVDDVKGVGITLKGSKDNGCISENGEVYDFVSRYFAPWLGIPEDPVTGSWHTVAAAYWAKDLDKTNLFARQCSKRGGELRISVDGQRVHISGQAVINLKGTFYL